MRNNLLSFFYERSNILKSHFAFTYSNEDIKVVAIYNFIVSNEKLDEENTTKIDSILDLEKAVESYYSDTDIYFKEKLVYSKPLNEDNEMFVHLMLP